MSVLMKEVGLGRSPPRVWRPVRVVSTGLNKPQEESNNRQQQDIRAGVNFMVGDKIDWLNLKTAGNDASFSRRPEIAFW